MATLSVDLRKKILLHVFNDQWINPTLQDQITLTPLNVVEGATFRLFQITCPWRRLDTAHGGCSVEYLVVSGDGGGRAYRDNAVMDWGTLWAVLQGYPYLKTVILYRIQWATWIHGRLPLQQEHQIDTLIALRLPNFSKLVMVELTFVDRRSGSHPASAMELPPLLQASNLVEVHLCNSSFNHWGQGVWVAPWRTKKLCFDTPDHHTLLASRQVTGLASLELRNVRSADFADSGRASLCHILQHIVERNKTTLKYVLLDLNMANNGTCFTSTTISMLMIIKAAARPWTNPVFRPCKHLHTVVLCLQGLDKPLPSTPEWDPFYHNDDLLGYPTNIYQTMVFVLGNLPSSVRKIHIVFSCGPNASPAQQVNLRQNIAAMPWMRLGTSLRALPKLQHVEFMATGVEDRHVWSSPRYGMEERVIQALLHGASRWPGPVSRHNYRCPNFEGMSHIAVPWLPYLTYFHRCDSRFCLCSRYSRAIFIFVDI